MVTRVGLVGGGAMDAGIAEMVARAGNPVLTLERDKASGAAAIVRLENSLPRAERAGKLSREATDSARSLVSITLVIDDFADREVIIEARPAIEEIKLDLSGDWTTSSPTQQLWRPTHRPSR